MEIKVPKQIEQLFNKAKDACVACVDKVTLELKLGEAEATINRLFAELGEAFYYSVGDDEDDKAIDSLCEALDEVLAYLEALHKQHAALTESQEESDEEDQPDTTATVFCSKCGVSHDADDVFCKKCGSKLKK